jgi:beta-galactosidase GanA
MTTENPAQPIATLTDLFPFGTQYLRGATPPPADWDRDLASCRAHGMNIVRAWLVWGVLEPERGVIDHAYLACFLDTAHRHGLKVGLLFHLHGCPEWAIRDHKDCWYVDRHGKPFEPAPRANTPSGGWPGLCPDHAQTKILEERFIAAVVEQVKDHPAVAFFEPINEPHQWIDFTVDPPEPFCYCPATRAAFSAWLREKYRELPALEHAWGRRVPSWEDARPPTWRFSIPDEMDFRAFTLDSITGLVRRRTAIIRKHSTLPVAAHAWGGGCVTCANLGSMAFDDWRHAREVDIWGYSAFPSRADQVVSVGLGTVATRNAANGKPFWQAELGAGDYGTLFHRGGRLPPEVEAQFCWESLRQGAQGLLFWQFRKEAHGTESGAFGLTTYDGSRTPTLEAVAKIGAVLARHRALFQSAKPLAPKVALVFSLKTCLAEWAAMRHSRLSIDSLAGWFRMFWDADIPVDVVHEEFVDAAALAKYRLVVLASPGCLHGNLRGLLAGYVAEGGHLLSDPYCCAFTEEGHLTPTTVPGGGLDSLFACREIDITSHGGRQDDVQQDGRTYRIRAGHFRESFTLTGNGTAWASYSDGTPAIVANRHGRGRAVMSGVNLGLSHSARQSISDDAARAGAVEISDAQDLVLKIAAEAGVSAPLISSPGLRASLLPAGEWDLLIILNIRAVAVNGEVALRETVLAAEELVSGVAHACAGKVVPVVLPGYGSLALRVRRADG